MNDEQNVKKQEQNSMTQADKDLDFFTKLNYAVIDRSELSYDEKRNLLFGMYSFRCLFDTNELHRASKILVKYGCSFLSKDKSVNDYPHTYEVKDENGNVAIKYDAGSPYWQSRVKNKLLTGENAILPQKPTLYELALSIITLQSATDEIRSVIPYRYYSNLIIFFHFDVPLSKSITTFFDILHSLFFYVLHLVLPSNSFPTA